MAPYLFGVRNGIHIIDLQQTVPALHRGIQAIRDVVAAGGRVLFVGTKRAAAEIVAESAKRCGQYYVNHRWLGGMLTNWKTISLSIKRLREIESALPMACRRSDQEGAAEPVREQDKLERALGGIKEMGGLPDIIFIIDTNKEALAVQEANKLGHPGRMAAERPTHCRGSIVMPAGRNCCRGSHDRDAQLVGFPERPGLPCWYR